MRHLQTAAVIALWFSATSVYGDYKYQEGDCITPTNETWSWYQRFAIVTGVFERKDADFHDGNVVYMLRILEGSKPWQKNWDDRFKGQLPYTLDSIDAYTQKVPSWMCERNQSG